MKPMEEVKYYYPYSEDIYFFGDLMTFYVYVYARYISFPHLRLFMPFSKDLPDIKHIINFQCIKENFRFMFGEVDAKAEEYRTINKWLIDHE